MAKNPSAYLLFLAILVLTTATSSSATSLNVAVGSQVQVVGRVTCPSEGFCLPLAHLWLVLMSACPAMETGPVSGKPSPMPAVFTASLSTGRERSAVGKKEANKDGTTCCVKEKARRHVKTDVVKTAGIGDGLPKTGPGSIVGQADISASHRWARGRRNPFDRASNEASSHNVSSASQIYR
ncbi:hypothetical protein FEM48_Zijuj12G0136100 [Ziziphus jujuba var. spinosa]|uniref:Uncharacterized protein n=1 Tax=Ziziphus jujuba var. spinosa TaxID=714518 RepID=A0A978UDM7_ZIZJJ|nr:hypothetical protein FEM48_Zijuj12G0136100 [Ziziphus jujuba var. spinosa]